MEKKEKFASDTSGRNASAWAKALIVLLIGLTIAHLGVTLFLLSGLGTDTFTVFIQGLSRVFGLTVGTVPCNRALYPYDRDAADDQRICQAGYGCVCILRRADYRSVYMDDGRLY